jgi:hypothetical protein
MSGLLPIATELRIWREAGFVPISSASHPSSYAGCRILEDCHWDVPKVPGSELAALIAGGGQLIQKS